MLGAAAGAVGTLATIPLDVLKTRLQTQAQLPAGERAYTSYAGQSLLRALRCCPVRSPVRTKDAVRTIAREEGVRAFWRGCGPRLVQTMPAAAITFSVYEVQFCFALFDVLICLIDLFFGVFWGFGTQNVGA